jgi:hypothetical protein
MTAFDWSGPTGRGHYSYSYRYNENTTELSRSIGVAGVVYDAGKNCYRIYLSYHFNDLVPPTAYIIKHKYPTLEAAKRAVERKVPGLVAVLKIQGIQI